MKLHLFPLLISTLAVALLPITSAQSDPLDVYRAYPPCNLCGDPSSAYVTKGGVSLPEGTGGILQEELTCSAAEALAEDGLLSPASCLLLGLRVSNECGCTNARNPTGSSPTGPNAPTPTAPPPPTPANPPVPMPTPTAPTSGPVPVTGMTFVRLDPITGGTIPEDELSAIDRACATFLDNAITTISDVDCMSSVVSSSDGDGPVEVELIVTATSTEPETITSFSETIRNAINDDRDGFIDVLQDESSFFDSLTSANSGLDSPVSESDDDGLSNGQIAGIIGGSVVAFFLVLLVALSISQSKKKDQVPTSGVTISEEPRTTMWNPPANNRPKMKKIPIASAAAVVTAAHGSSDASVTRAAGLLSDDNASLTDQSLTDGSTMSSLRPEMQSRDVVAPSVRNS